MGYLKGRYKSESSVMTCETELYRSPGLGIQDGLSNGHSHGYLFLCKFDAEDLGPTLAKLGVKYKEACQTTQSPAPICYCLDS